MDQSLGIFPHESLSQTFGVMADSLHFSSASHFAPPSYFSQQHTGHLHVVAPSVRQDTITTQRKRPKYTRSKTGCLTCRAKKIKCDESKPNCLRCTHGQRECTWPEGVPARKKPTPKGESAMDIGVETRPSTAGSSGVSDTSTPIRDITPPTKREPVDIGLPSLASRRHSEPLIQLPTMSAEANAVRRQSLVLSSTSAHTYPLHPSSHTQMLPAILEVSTSYSTHQQYHNAYPATSHHYAQSPSLVLPRVSSHHDQLYSVRQIDPSSNVGPWPSPPLLHSVDPLEPYFHSVQERNLIRHYCDNSLSIIMAFPFENPVLAANLQFVFDRGRGSDSAVESLRNALLGTAAVHRSFLQSRRGQGGADEAMQLALSYRSKSKQLLTTACTTQEGVQSDAALGAAIAIVLIDVSLPATVKFRELNKVSDILWGQNWAATLNFAKVLVNFRGGPAVLLARSSHSKSGTVTGVWRARLLLEILAVYELFGCLANAQEPTLLSPNASSWWLDTANSEDSRSYVEKVFGVSREFVPHLAQVTTFVAHVLKSRSRIEELPVDDPTEENYVREARALYSALENWTRLAEPTPQRIRAGDRIYRNVSQIILLREVLHVPPDDALVQQHADTILSLCLDCGQSRMSVDLNWPVIIAGSQVYGSDRTRVLAIFESFRSQCCYEIETAEHIVLQVWKRLDEKSPRADWRSVMRDLNLNALIL